jgi:hypothetical protein
METNAQAIANYQMAPIEGNGLQREGGSETMAEVMRLNPDYKAPLYAGIKAAQQSIMPGGSLYQPIQSMNVTMGHAAHFLDLATQLGNFSRGSWANIVPNTFASGTGGGRIVNNLKQTAFAMAEEGNRIYAGNAGTETAIDEWKKTFPVNGSLAEQAGAVQNLAQLMKDKFDTMTYQTNQALSYKGQQSSVDLLTPQAAQTLTKLTTMAIPGSPSTVTPTYPTLPPGFRVVQ